MPQKLMVNLGLQYVSREMVNFMKVLMIEMKLKEMYCLILCRKNSKHSDLKFALLTDIIFLKFLMLLLICENTLVLGYRLRLLRTPSKEKDPKSLRINAVGIIKCHQAKFLNL